MYLNKIKLQALNHSTFVVGLVRYLKGVQLKFVPARGINKRKVVTVYEITITPKSSGSFKLGAEHRLAISYNMMLDSGVSSPTSAININECQITCYYSKDFTSLGITEGSKVVIYDTVNGCNKFTGNITSIKNRVASDTNTVILMCEDCLSGLLDKTIPEIQIEKDVTLNTFLSMVLKSLGVSYRIDDAISSTNINFAFAIGSKLGEFLSTVKVAYGLLIYADEDGILQIKPKKASLYQLKPIDGSNYIIRTSLGSSLSSSYSVVKVGYTHMAIKQSELVLEIKDIQINSGLNNLNSYSLSNGDLYAVNYIKIISVSDDCELVNYEASQKEISMVINNKGDAPVKCTIQIYGYCLGVVESYITKENSTALARIGRKEFTITNKLIQDEAHANSIASDLINEVSKEIPYVECDVINVNDFNLNQYVSLNSIKLGFQARGYVHSIKGNLANDSLSKGSITLKLI